MYYNLIYLKRSEKLFLGVFKSVFRKMHNLHNYTYGLT